MTDAADERANGPEAGGSAAGDGEAYRGLFGAFRYALGASDSLLFRSYVVVAGLVGLLVSLLVGAGVVQLVGETAGVQGGTLTLTRAFYIVVGVFVLLPLFGPVLSVARRRRRGERGGNGGRADVALALAGYLFLASLYLALVVSAPAGVRDPPAGTLAPAIRFLYGLPAVYGLVPPLVAAGGVLATHWFTR